MIYFFTLVGVVTATGWLFKIIDRIERPKKGGKHERKTVSPAAAIAARKGLLQGYARVAGTQTAPRPVYQLFQMEAEQTEKN